MTTKAFKHTVTNFWSPNSITIYYIFTALHAKAFLLLIPFLGALVAVHLSPYYPQSTELQLTAFISSTQNIALKVQNSKPHPAPPWSYKLRSTATCHDKSASISIVCISHFTVLTIQNTFFLLTCLKTARSLHWNFPGNRLKKKKKAFSFLNIYVHKHIWHHSTCKPEVSPILKPISQCRGGQKPLLKACLLLGGMSTQIQSCYKLLGVNKGCERSRAACQETSNAAAESRQLCL